MDTEVRSGRVVAKRKRGDGGEETWRAERAQRRGGFGTGRDGDVVTEKKGAERRTWAGTQARGVEAAPW